MKRRHFIQTSLSATGATLLLDRFSQTTIAANAPRKIALLIGINDYSHGNTDNVSSLKGCINDVALIQNLLIYRYGFESKNIITLTNAQATRNDILNTIETYLLTANPNDIVVFSFSGHGAPLNDPYEKGTLSKTTGIIPYDHIMQPDGITNFITGTTLFLLRSAFKTNQVTFILDCCYSGGSIRAQGDTRSRATEPTIGNTFYPNVQEQQIQQKWLNQLKINLADFNQFRKLQQGPKGVMLSAATEFQTAQDSSFNNSYSAGAFTKFLTDALWENADRSLLEIEMAVSRSLANLTIDPKDAQQPVFTYPNNERSTIQSQSTFFTPATFAKTPLQGTVLSSNPNTREIKLWLGGLAPRTLGIEPGTEFRLLTTPNKKLGTIATLTQKVASDFTSIASIPVGQPIPNPGTLLQHYYRPIPKDFNIKIGLDQSLGKSVQFPTTISQIQGIPRQSDSLFDGVDLIFSQMTSDYQQSQGTPSPPPVGTYGLFSNQLKIVPNSFGPMGETLNQAIDRLMPLFKANLIRKLFNTMVVTDPEFKDISNVEAKVYLKDSPNTTVALPNQVKRSVQIGQKIEVRLHNKTGEDLQALLIAITPNGRIKHRYYPEGSFTQSMTIETEDGTGNNGEFLILLSTSRLDGINENINQLLAEFSDRSGSRFVDNQMKSILIELNRSSRSALGKVNQLVLSLPIHILN